MEFKTVKQYEFFTQIHTAKLGYIYALTNLGNIYFGMVSHVGDDIKWKKLKLPKEFNDL